MSTSAEKPVSWIAVDWGTTHMRAWAMDADDRVLHRTDSADGMGRLDPDQFEAAFLTVADDWLAAGRTTDALVCGMAGARTGWVESGYQSLPCRPQSTRHTVAAPVSDPRLRVRILYGLKQDGPDNFAEWLDAGAAGFGIGSNLYKPGDTPAEVSKRAGTIVQAYDAALNG